MNREDLSNFELLGYDCPMGCYPGPVVPIGRLAGRLVAIYHSEDGETEAIEIADRAKFVVHDAGLAATLSSYNAATELLFASSPAKVEAYQLRYGKVDLLRFRHYSEDPFYRLTLSSATDSLETIKQDVKACLQKILVSAPDLAPSWYADWRQKLGDRYPSVELPTDFGEFVGLLPPASTSYASVQRGALTAVSQQSSVPLARLEQVHKVFVTDEIETHALVDINLSIYRGEYVMIAGPSGCGKSSLLAILGLLDSPTRGGYFINGVPVSQLSLKERARIRDHEIGFVFQAFNLIGDLNVFENVELPLTYRGVSATERRRRVGEALEKVGMSHRMKHYPSQLSGGQQQRIAIARAVVGDPSILLADEPTGNLDSQNGELIMQLLSELHSNGATICMVTHDPRYWRYASHVVNMFDGRIVDEVNVLSPI